MTEKQENIKKQFFDDRDKLFQKKVGNKNAFKFCIEYSLLVEEYIRLILKNRNFDFVIASAGSFCRRELSPYSDIDLMFIVDDVDSSTELLQNCITSLWDFGLEVSSTVRVLDDIDKFLAEDLHAFTQFFETRYLIGKKSLYNNWNKELIKVVKGDVRINLISQLIEDYFNRHNKFGDSPKALEPNIKETAGGLRDLHTIEWIGALDDLSIQYEQDEISQTERFLAKLKKESVYKKEIKRLAESYNFLLGIRIKLHLLYKRKNDRLEFNSQEKLITEYKIFGGSVEELMKNYFEAASIINRFSKTMIKLFKERIAPPVSDQFMIELDEDFSVKDTVVSINHSNPINLSQILRAFYYRGKYGSRFGEKLRSLIIENTIEIDNDLVSEQASSVFFREILKLPKNVGTTLTVMNELGVLGKFLPEFKELIGFFQPGVYHCFTADEHSIIAIKNLEKLENESTTLGKLFVACNKKDLLFLTMLFHDIAKTLSISGHEIIGAEIACTVMERLGYEQNEISLVQLLVRNHLMMEQVAFRRNLNDPETLNKFTEIFSHLHELEMLYLVTYADLSAVSPAIWTQWKNDLLDELFKKSKMMLIERVDAVALLNNSMNEIIENADINDNKVIDHIESINDVGYLEQFTEEEINSHVQQIEHGSKFSVFFKEDQNFTNITIIANDSESLLSKLCGALSVNDLNIHDAKIYTRDDGIVIDSFNITDFRLAKPVSSEKYKKIEVDIKNAVVNRMQISKEFNKVKSRWRRIEERFFKRKGQVKVCFEKHDIFTIIDVYSPDRLGLLYEVTRKMHQLGLSIYFAKISTKGDDVVDAFYTLDRNGKKISPNIHELIKFEISQTIKDLL